MSSFRGCSMIFILVAFGMISCVSSKKVVYLNNIADTTSGDLRKAQSAFETPIQKNDLLSIAIGGSNADDLTSLNSGSGVIPGASVGGVSSKSIGYLVEADGKIQLPFLGRVQAEGLTRIQLQDTLTGMLKDYTKDPVVNIKFLNYSYSVLGEVSHPGKYEMSSERTTILDAIAMANDVTIFGKRNNVLIVREIDGKREFGRVSLLSKDIFNSPYYYLKTNDVVYVEPLTAKFFTRTGIPQFIGIAAAAIGLFLGIVSLSRL